MFWDGMFWDKLVVSVKGNRSNVVMWMLLLMATTASRSAMGQGNQACLPVDFIGECSAGQGTRQRGKSVHPPTTPLTPLAHPLSLHVRRLLHGV